MRQISLYLFALLLPLSIFSQDCLNLPDTLFVCGFSEVLPSSQIEGNWAYLCDESPGTINMNTLPNNTTEVTVNQCGMYFFEYTGTNPACLEIDTVLFFFDDPSSVNNNIGNSIGLGYSGGFCPSGGFTCGGGSFGGLATITAGGGTLPDIGWNYDIYGFCSSTNYITALIGADPTGCFADDILLDTILGSDTDSILFSGLEDYVIENFFELYDSLTLDLLDSLDCVLLNAGCSSFCYDTIDIENNPNWEPITYDTVQVIIPHSTGEGSWHHYINANNIIPLQDTSIIVVNNTNYRLIINSGADYFGPGNLNYSLDEVFINGTDTIYFQPDFGFVSLQLEWQNFFEYDTITQIRTHYNSPTVCIGCGGVSTSISSPIPDNGIFDVPSFPCGPITLSWEFDLCACNPPDIEAFVEGSINCANPCANVYFNTFSGGPINQGVCIVIGPIGDVTTILPNDSFSACFEGDYQVEFYDDNGCFAATSFTVEADFEEFESEFFAEVCEGDCFDWNGQQYCTEGNFEQTFAAQQNGCDSIVTLSLIVNPFIEEYEQYEVCPGGDWNGYPAGEYQEYYTDGNFCYIQYILITETDVAETYDYIDFCDGECIDWNGMLICETGFYETQMNINGCMISAYLEANTFPIPSPNISISNDLNCIDDEATISIIGNFDTYSWSNGTTGSSITVSSGGEYTVSITNSGGCFSTETVVVNENFEGETFFIQENICSGECININGVDYCETGVYESSSTGPNGCENITVHEVFVDEYIPVEISVSGEVGCVGVPVTLSISDANVDLEYIWSTGETGNSIEVNQIGNYSVIIITPNDCSYMSFTTVEETEEPIGEVYEESFFLCPGDCYTDSIGNTYCDSGIYTSELDNGFGCLDTYILNINNISGNISFGGELPSLDCTSSSVSLNDIIVETENATFDYFIVTNPNGDETIYQDELPNLELNQSGEYLITGYFTSISGSECETSFDFVIEENNEVFQIEIAETELNCVTGTAIPEVILSIQGDFDYTWQGPSINSDNQNSEQPALTEAGEYSLTVYSQATNCESTTSFLVPSMPDITFETLATPSCEEENIGSIAINNIVNGNAPYLYSIDNQNWQSVSDFQELEIGEYNVIVQDVNGCEGEKIEDIAAIAQIPSIEITEYTICGDTDLMLDASINMETELNYLWLNGNETPTINVSTEGFYELEISNQCYSIMETFTVIDDLKSPENFAYIPTAFSPSGMDENKIFRGYFGKEITEYNLQVFDRWGSAIFSSQNPEIGWNGEGPDGKMLNSGIYVWVMTGKMESCTGIMDDVKFYGDVFLVK